MGRLVGFVDRNAKVGHVCPLRTVQVSLPCRRPASPVRYAQYLLTMRKIILIIFLILTSSILKSEEDYIVTLNNGVLYYETYKSDNKREVIDLDNIGNSHKKRYRLIKAEFDTTNSNIAHCYAMACFTKSECLLLLLCAFDLKSGALLSYKEYNVKSKSLTTYFEQLQFEYNISNIHDRSLTQSSEGFTYTTGYGIFQTPTDCFVSNTYPCEHNLFFEAPGVQYSVLQYIFPTIFVNIDLSPDERYLACGFMDMKNSFAFVGPGCKFYIYEYNFNNKQVIKIIERGTQPRYSKNSKYIIYRKIKQTWGLYRFRNMGYYIYDRETNGFTFFRHCDEACFIREARSYISFDPDDVLLR